MSNLSELLPTGGGQNAVDFVASGTLSSGQTVVLNSDGTVSAVAESAEGAGTPVVFEEDAAGSSFGEFSLAYDTAQNKIVIVYSEAAPNYYGTAVVGTVSGTSISFGTPVVFNSAVTYFPATTYDSNAQKIVAVYRNGGNSNYGTAKVGTVSGTSISFGTGVVYSGTALSNYQNIVFDSTNNKVVVIWGDNLNSNYVTGSVGTVSGTSISFGTKVQAATAYTNYQYGISYDPTNGKVVTAFRNTANSSYGTAIVGSVSGTSISFGSPVVFASITATKEKVVYDSASTKTVVFYRDDSAADYVKAAVGTVSGTSISFGSIVSTNVQANSFTAVANSDLGVINVGILDTTNDGFNVVGTVSGTSISFGTPLEWKDAATLQYINGTYDPTAKKTIYAYNDFDNSEKGTAVVFQNESSNNTDFIGITAEAISDTATGAVNVYGGINEAQTGLTIGSDYYVQSDGSLSTTASDVKVGQAISATTINMMDLT